MITLLIFAVAGLIIGLLYAWEENYWIDEWYLYPIRGTVGAIVGAFFGVVVGAFIIPKDSEEYISYTANIETISDNSAITGSFVLGCGTIDNTMKYSFYLKTNQNEYRLKVIDCDMATVSYTDSVPRIVEYSKRWIDTKHNRKFCIGKELIVEGIGLRYKIYVPKGSIRQNYVLDAQ